MGVTSCCPALGFNRLYSSEPTSISKSCIQRGKRQDIIRSSGPERVCQPARMERVSGTLFANMDPKRESPSGFWNVCGKNQAKGKTPKLKQMKNAAALIV